MYTENTLTMTLEYSNDPWDRGTLVPHGMYRRKATVDDISEVERHYAFSDSLDGIAWELIQKTGLGMISFEDCSITEIVNIRVIRNNGLWLEVKVKE